MIYYNNNTINDWDFGTSNINKVYRNNAVCYQKIESGSVNAYKSANNWSTYASRIQAIPNS